MGLARGDGEGEEREGRSEEEEVEVFEVFFFRQVFLFCPRSATFECSRRLHSVTFDAICSDRSL